ncbi:hypothetical protein [Halobaculum litoreum]|uniref:RING-type E3 ubiquitin transferase n=1 Tax=Halobaculum litoreum TaxID=3031998 RepID=A0ABD5XVL0_9EURY|nr:hypothetical protein [Halobaculum sp. DT92]
MTGVETVRGFDGRIERSFHQLGRGSEGVRFRLDDGTGSVVVDARGASLRLAEEAVPDPVSDPVERRDLSRSVRPDGPRRYYEARVDPGETVVVRGTVGPGDESLSVDRIGVQISGRGVSVADTDRRGAVRRGAGATAVSVVLGVAALGVAALIAL